MNKDCLYIDGSTCRHKKCLFNEYQEACDYCDRYEPKEDEKVNKVIEGVGKDAEIVTNAQGGKQSKSPMAMHLVDPFYLHSVFKSLTDLSAREDEYYKYYIAIQSIADFMVSGAEFRLIMAMNALCEDKPLQVITIAKVLKEGAERYEANNWRLIPQEEHINHALIHLIAHISGDTQDNHTDHALCRLMMSLATKKSDNFNYTEYIKKAA